MEEDREEGRETLIQKPRQHRNQDYTEFSINITTTCLSPCFLKELDTVPNVGDIILWSPPLYLDMRP